MNIKIEWKQCLKIGISIFALFLCINYWNAVANTISVFISGVTPILIGCVVAYMVNIFMSGLEKRYFPNSTKEGVIKSRRPVCMALAIVIVLGVIALLIYMIIPELIRCIETFINGMPDLIKEISQNKYVKRMVSQETLDQLKNMKWDSYFCFQELVVR